MDEWKCGLCIEADAILKAAGFKQTERRDGLSMNADHRWWKKKTYGQEKRAEKRAKRRAKLREANG